MAETTRASEVLRLHEGVLSHRANARATINSLLAAGRVVRVYPGVFVDVNLMRCRRTRLAAALAARPAAVLWRESAVAAITGDDRPFVKGELIQLSQPQAGAAPRGLVVYRRRSPAVRSFHGLRCPPAAVVAAESAGQDDGKTAELFLREGLVSPQELVDALLEFSRTPEQATRRRVLVSYRDNPWSGGERELHLVLNDAGITGWVANVPVRVGGLLCYPDVLFIEARLILEFDGFAVHGNAAAFEADRIRQNRLVLAGYRVLRYTWKRLQHDPVGIIAEIQAALAAPADVVIC